MLPKSLSAEDLWRLPEDHLRHELVRGELTTKPYADAIHGQCVAAVILFLSQYGDRHNCGVFIGPGTGFHIAHAPDTVLAPDVAFIRKGRFPPDDSNDGYFPGAPDLAVEVLSPSDSASEIMEKIDEWLTAGTRLVWVVDPAKKSVGVYAPDHQPRILKSNDQLDGDEVLPGFSLAVAKIFR
jgi:Uma2 family endonuclease